MPQLSIKHMFATPLVITALSPETATIVNSKLRTLIFERSQKHPTAHNCNRGGWQSDDGILDWGGPPVQIVIDKITEILAVITMYIDGQGFKRAAIDWKINGWANLNRKGDANAAHVHPGAYWSAVYYVHTGTHAVDKGRVGAIEFFDPRASMPLLYCPKLRMGIEGYVTAGMSEIHAPEPGQIIIFPSWLSHSVQPFKGDDYRLSLAFNFSV